MIISSQQFWGFVLWCDGVLAVINLLVCNVIAVKEMSWRN